MELVLILINEKQKFFTKRKESILKFYDIGISSNSHFFLIFNIWQNAVVKTR